MRHGRFFVENAGSLAALSLARGIGATSRLWGQRGLGTMFQALSRIPPLARAMCQVEISEGSYFQTPVFEAYWAPIVVARRPYETEIYELLRELRGIDTTFVDCGANYGYWSVVATSREIGISRAVAIEPNPPTYAVLRENAELNSNRFVCLQKAASDVDGESVTLGMPESPLIAFITKDGTPGGVEVETTTIDTALEELGWADTRPVVMKLDVEGHELPAIAGARKTRERTDHALIVEDFAYKDFPAARVLLGDGYVLSYVTADRKCHRITSIAEARRWIAQDGRLQRYSNLIASRPGGVLDARISAWARRY